MKQVTLAKIWLFLILSSYLCLAEAKHGPLALHQLADYDAELRLPNGRVDTAKMARRLHELGVTTYYWLIAHAKTDWEDLKLFLPEANRAHIEVWAYLVPPSESAPNYGTSYPEPFRLDYKKWAEEIARLSLEQTNLTTWVIDDFYQNHPFFTPAYIGEMQKRAKQVNPRLQFWPLMYYGELRRKFVEDYRNVIDGVVAAYPQGRDEIEHAWALLNDTALAQPGELSFPSQTQSQPGDFIMVSETAKVLKSNKHALSFVEFDDFTGPTAGYHFKQVLLNKKVIWEEDVAGGTNGWREVKLNLPEQIPPDSNIILSFRLYDKKGVGNFGVCWRFKHLKTEGLKLASALDRPADWQVEQRGEFEAGFGATVAAQKRNPRFHIPLIVMTAAQPVEFKLRHGEPTTPERIAQWLRFCLEAMRDKKCDGVVTYCLDKSDESNVFPGVQKLFQEFK